jgi:hypothetical protein
VHDLSGERRAGVSRLRGFRVLGLGALRGLFFQFRVLKVRSAGERRHHPLTTMEFEEKRRREDEKLDLCHKLRDLATPLDYRRLTEEQACMLGRAEPGIVPDVSFYPHCCIFVPPRMRQSFASPPRMSTVLGFRVWRCYVQCCTLCTCFSACSVSFLAVEQFRSVALLRCAPGDLRLFAFCCCHRSSFSCSFFSFS